MTDRNHSPRSPRADRRLWLGWLLAGLVGYGVGGPAGVALGVPGWIIENGFLSIALSATLTAALQWLLLRRHFGPAGWWLPAALLASASAGLVIFAGLATGMRPVIDVAWILGASLLPALGAWLQWRQVLRPRLRRGAWQWVLAGLLGWLAGGIGGGFLGAALGIDGKAGGLPSVLTWSIFGAAYGAVTGAVLLRLLRGPRHEARGAAALPLLLLALLIPPRGASARSLDLAIEDVGISIGNSPRFTGLRLNAVDRGVERIDGLNLTLWTPRENPEAAYGGVALALIGTKARTVDGLALSGIGINARECLRGVGAGTLGVGAGKLTGVAAGLAMVDIEQEARGILLAGGWTGDRHALTGIALSAGAATARSARGALLGGLFAAAPEGLDGLALGLGGFYSARLRGLGCGGLGGGGEQLRGLFATGLGLGCGELRGIGLTLGGLGGMDLQGIAVAGLGLGAGERIRGIGLGGVVVFAPEVVGLSAGALNGFYVDRIDLEDFLHFRMVNRRMTGLALGLVNYTAELRGVQLGLLNYAGNNPRGLRLLPFVNLHL